MISNYINERGLVILGCGKMGSALLSGWLKTGLEPSSVWILDPEPSEWSTSIGAHLNVNLPENPAIVLIAVKPQMMKDVLLPLKATLSARQPLIISIAAGINLPSLQAWSGCKSVVRSMPNTPALTGTGATGLFASSEVTLDQRNQAEAQPEPEQRYRANAIEQNEKK